MTENNKPSKWDDTILNMVTYGAMNAQSPTVIAENIGLTGELRRQFLLDIVNPKTAIGSEYRKNISIAQKDVETTLHFLQLQGDTDAMEVAIKRERKEYIARIKEDLFGL